jgi:hypothetical protein
MIKYLTLACIFLNLFSASAQMIDHWETVIFHDDIWRYMPGMSEPPSDWREPSFNAADWELGQGGIGYSDNDDNTIIPNVIALYLRKEFDIIDTAVIRFAILNADYDDAFVAYLNGVEFARSNIGEPGIPPSYNQTSDGLHEAEFYDGEAPESYHIFPKELKSLLKEGSNTLAIQVHNDNIASSDLSSNFFFSVGITNGSMDYNETPDWFSQTLFSSNLPLILINTTETNEIYDEPKVPANMGIIDNGPGQINSMFDIPNDYEGRIAIEIRGASSQSFPKKNYGFETQLDNGENNNVKLLGLPKENDWVLHGPYSDKSLLRNVLAYHMGEVTGQYTPRTRLCEVFINDNYRGVYVLTERIKQDNNRVDIDKLTSEDIEGDELTGGYIFQIDRDNESIWNDGWQSNFPDWKFFAFDDPDYDVIMPEQRAYIHDYMDGFEAMMNSSVYGSAYNSYVDVDSWVDYFLITEIGKHIDAFKLSFFMYKKKDSNGGKLHFGPLWDFNLAFGNFDFVCSPDPEGWVYQFRGTCDNWHPFWVAKLAEIPQVSHQTNCRWMELRTGPLHTDTLMQFIDDNFELLEDANERNFERWEIIGDYVWPNDYVGESYQDEVEFLKFWLTQRLTWMDDNMIGDCDLLNVSVDESSIVDINVYPNPVGNVLYVELNGGQREDFEFQLFDLLGNQLKSLKLTNEQNILPLAGMPNGMYVYTVSHQNNQLVRGKLIKNYTSK